MLHTFKHTPADSEQKYPAAQAFLPSLVQRSPVRPFPGTSQAVAPFYFRHYGATNAYLGVNSSDNNVYYKLGNASPVNVPAKGRWMGSDIARWARRYGVPFRFNPHFPINTLTLMRGATGLQLRAPERFARYCEVVSKAMWEEGANLGDPGVLAATLAAAGFDVEAFTALVADPEVKARLVATTEEAVARGVFGAPTFFVGEAMFFGQDRLDFVREALRG